MSKITVIHHSADFDGIFCREIARKFMPAAELIGWDHGDKKLPFPSEGTVYVLDLSPDCFEETKHVPGAGEVVNWLDAERLIWIDHHKSSIEKWPKDIPGYRIDGVAACRLAWQWFATAEHNAQNATNEALQIGLPEKNQFVQRAVCEPLAVRLAGEYDIWDKRDPNAETFQFGLRSQELGESMWELMLSGPNPDEGDKRGAAEITVDALLENGELLQRYQQRNDANIVNYRSFIVEFEGLKFLALNTARCNSLTFAAKDVPETGHDALMGFYWTGWVWKVSLYHAKHRTELDLSEIAVREGNKINVLTGNPFGGGGHRGACGFEALRLPFLL